MLHSSLHSQAPPAFASAKAQGTGLPVADVTLERAMVERGNCAAYNARYAARHAATLTLRDKTSDFEYSDRVTQIR
jgi:hypothetical protein